jgi:hypothetical protein
MKILLLLSLIFVACDSTTTSEPVDGSPSGTWQWTVSGDTTLTNPTSGGTMTFSQTADKTYSGNVLVAGHSYDLTAVVDDSLRITYSYTGFSGTEVIYMRETYALKYIGNNVWRGRQYSFYHTENEPEHYTPCEMSDHKPCIFYLYR